MINEGLRVLESYEGKPLYEETVGLVIGQLASTVIKTDSAPEAMWTGARIPEELIRQCAAFSEYCADKYNGEVQGRLYYSRATDEWSATCVEQWISRTLESEEIDSEGNIEAAVKNLPKGKEWIQMGTWHSHVDIKAYQSKTDYNDEIKQNGIHITFGEIKHENFMLHTRITHMGINYDKGDNLGNEILPESMDMSTKDLPDFPKEWAESLKERPPLKTTPFPKALNIPIEYGIKPDTQPGAIVDIDYDKYAIMRDMAKHLFPDESFESICYRLGSMHIEQQYYQTQFEFENQDGTASLQYYSCLCGDETANSDGVCDACRSCM